MRDNIESLRLLAAGWNGYDAPAPSASSVESALAVYDKIVASGLSRPDQVCPFVDGGVAFSYYQSEREAHVRFENDGTVSLVLLAERKMEDAIEVMELENQDALSACVEAVRYTKDSGLSLGRQID